MIIKVLVVIAVIIVAVLVFATTRPDTFRITRSITVAAPPEKIFPLIDSLRNWDRWNTEDQTPGTKQSFSGPASGVGASGEWSGKGSVGAGRMLITESVPFTKVTVQVDWEKPFKARNINEFTLLPNGNMTLVTWSMHGPNLYIMKLMSVFTSMDRVMGKHFEDGLAKLKTEVER